MPKPLQLLLLSLGLFFSTLIHSAPQITFIAENYRPLSYLEQGKLEGPSADIVRMLKASHDNNQPIQVYPWARAYKKTLNTPGTALFSTTRTQEREHEFKWVGPLAEKHFELYALRSSRLKIHSLKDAKQYLIGVERGTINQQLLNARGLHLLDEAVYPKQNLKKLVLGRIDLWCVARSTFRETLAQLKLNSSEFEAVFTVKTAKLYIAFNKQTPDPVIQSWQASFDELYRSGTVKAIFHQHGQLALYPSLKGPRGDRPNVRKAPPE
ncbi:substrate-binding periplasmic protein [Dongshaea marina]|uniref:substrate-binding periplasmic protein n=1 Tax=Dongshaea marina TaxID=2047966 RepID=UPI000D3E966E